MDLATFLDFWPLIFSNGLVDTLLGLLIGVYVVARAARKQWTDWLMSKEADPYMDRLAARVLAKLPPMPKVPTTDDFMAAIEPRIQGLEERISQPIDLDLGPIVKEVTENVTREVDKVRAVIDGKIGWEKKVEKQTAEVIADQLSREAMEARGIDPNGGQARLYKRLKDLMSDGKWQKEHPAAAAGVDALLGEMESEAGGLNLTTGPSSSAPRRTGH